jgi:hypothetical protein
MLRPALCLLIASCIPVLTGCDPGATEASRQTATASAATGRQQAGATGRQQFGEFSFELPENWSKASPDKAKTRAMLLFGGASWAEARGMIMVDVGTPATPTAQAMAESFAQSAGGQVARDGVDVDGETGVLVTTASTSLATPRVFIVVFRGGKAYLIMAAGVVGVDVRDPIERIRTTWKWSR